MKRIVLALALTALATSGAFAQSCRSQALSKEGKPLAGAAKNSHVAKCIKEG